MFNSMREEFESTVAPIMRDILDDARKLMRQEAQLVRTELQEDSQRAQSALVYGVCGGAFLFIGVALSSFMLVYAVATQWTSVPLWLAFGLVSLFLALLGAGFSFLAMRRWRSLGESSSRSIRALREGFGWMHRSA